MFQHIIDWYTLVLNTSDSTRTRMIAFDCIMEYQALRMKMLVQNYAPSLGAF